MSKKDRYKIFSDGNNKIVAVSSYAGRSVRGVAKCDPRDTFNKEYGESLAKARCAHKVALRRYKAAQSERDRALREMRKAFSYYKKMESYTTDLKAEEIRMANNVSKILSES